MKPTTVRLHFEGSILVEVEADPNDDEAWVDAIGAAWAAVMPHELSEATSLIEHEIEEGG